jgi:hypothetical protein
MTSQNITQFDQPTRNTRMIHQVSREYEKRDGKHRKGLCGRKGFLYKNRPRQTRGEHEEEQTGQPN